MPLDIAALIANMQAATGGALPPPPPLPTGFPPFPFAFPPQPQQHESAAWPPQMQDAAAYQPQIQAHYNQQTNGTKRQRDDGNNNNNNNNNNDRNQGKRPKNRGDHKPHKVLQCKFFAKGQCNKGENCTYIHDPKMIER
jgi:hypothetical protein